MDLSAAAGKVRIEVEVPDGFKDDDADGVSPNFQDVVLLDAPVVLPFAYATAPVATVIKGNEFSVHAALQGIPVDAKSLVFRLPEPQQEFIAASAGCSISEVALENRRTIEVMECPLVGDETVMSVDFTAKLPAGRGDLVARAGDQEIKSPIEGGTSPLE
jgi:hypothetical protein